MSTDLAYENLLPPGWKAKARRDSAVSQSKRSWRQ
jgi:hypothetical protein